MCESCKYLFFSVVASFFTIWFFLDAIKYNILRWGIWGYSLAIFLLFMIAVFSCPLINHKKFVCKDKKPVKKTKKVVKKKK